MANIWPWADVGQGKYWLGKRTLDKGGWRGWLACTWKAWSQGVFTIPRSGPALERQSLQGQRGPRMPKPHKIQKIKTVINSTMGSLF